MTTSSPEAESPPKSVARAWAMGLCASVGVMVLVAVEQRIQAAGVPVSYLMAERTSRVGAVGFVLAAVLASALAPRPWRSWALVGVSAVAYPFFLGRVSALVGGYVVVVAALARSRLRARYQVALALVLWAALPVCRWALSPRVAKALSMPLMIVWAGLAYSTVYLLIERARRRDKSTLPWDLFYLVALPRLVCPFFQPISPGYLVESQRGELSARGVSRAAALGLYAMVLAGIGLALRRIHSVPHPPLVEIPLEIIGTYCIFGKTIFTAASVFRLMGFEISSGMQRPFAARSFADFFRRFNHYVRDAVLSLFFIPLFVSFRRRRSPRVAAIAAAYVAIFVGSFALNQVLVPLTTNPDTVAALRASLSPVKMLMMLLYWTAIILPSAHFEPRVRPATASPRWLSTARFLVTYVGLWSAVWALRNWARLRA